MKFLIDTHVLLWWWSQPDKLSPRVRALIRDPSNRVWVSAASSWEITTKYRIGKLPSGGRIAQDWTRRMKGDGFSELDITPTHALKAGLLPGEHRDPFDRIIAAQSLVESLSVLSIDPALSSLGAERIWE